MSKKLNWVDYLDRLPGGPTDRQIASAAGTNPSTVTRWRKGQAPNPVHAVAIARQFDLHPFTALMAAGYLSLDEVDALVGSPGVAGSLTLDHVPSLSMIEELGRRIKAAEL